MRIYVRTFFSKNIYINHTPHCSDEEEEDHNTLVYLPISPEIDEPEEGWAGEQVSTSVTRTLKAVLVAPPFDLPIEHLSSV